MKALDLKHNEQDIAEKLRLEETRAKLAAAREGMEKEAQRIKEERDKKEQEASSKTRVGAAAAGMASGGKWLPPHMRTGAGSQLARERLGMKSNATQKLDTQDENLFPDLSAAEAIIEQQKQQQPAYRVPKKTPVGGGANWASRPKVEPAPKQKDEEPVKQESQPTESVEESSKQENHDTDDGVTEPPKVESSSETEGKAPIKPKKKKKKDISSFKPSSS